MNLREIAEFVGRDWRAIADSKAMYWAERFINDGWRPAWDAANALLVDMRRTRPDYPTDRDREIDFSDHLKLRARLDCAAHAFARR